MTTPDPTHRRCWTSSPPTASSSPAWTPARPAHHATLTAQLTALDRAAFPCPPPDDPAATSPSPRPPGGSSGRRTGANPVAQLARLGRPGLPPRLRPPRRRPRPMLARARPVSVRPGHRRRPVVRPVPPARTRPPAWSPPRPNTRPASCLPWPPSCRRDHPLRPHPAPGPRDEQQTPPSAGPGLRRRGWPVFPCHPGEKTPATTHGYRDATTDPAQITTWYTRRPDANLAIATGAPGPDVLDVDDYGPGRNGYAALAQLRDAGMLGNAAAYLRTPGGGLHAYYTGTTQRCAHLPPTAWTSCPPAVTSWPRPRPSTAALTSSSRPPAAPAP